MKHKTLLIPWSNPSFPPFPLPPNSIESPARKARLTLYHQTFLKEEKESGGRRIKTLWTGHHLDDQVENRLIWGYGMKSVNKMSGEIGPTRSDLKQREEEGGGRAYVVRPLLGFSKVGPSSLSVSFPSRSLILLLLSGKTCGNLSSS